MINERARALGLVLAVTLLPALGACGRDGTAERGGDLATDRDTAAVATGTGGTTGTATASALRVTDVELGRAIDSRGQIPDAAETDDFGPMDTIYVSVRTEGSTTGEATLTARWTFQDGQVVDETSRTIAPTAASHTEFHISKPDGFPAGDYRVEVLLDGKSVGTREFKVEKET